MNSLLSPSSPLYSVDSIVDSTTATVAAVTTTTTTTKTKRLLSSSSSYDDDNKNNYNNNNEDDDERNNNINSRNKKRSRTTTSTVNECISQYDTEVENDNMIIKSHYVPVLDRIQFNTTILPLLPLPEHHNDPDDYLLLLLHTMFPQTPYPFTIKSTSELKNMKNDTTNSTTNFFYTFTEEQMSYYTMELVNVVRQNNVTTLMDYYKTKCRTEDTTTTTTTKNTSVFDCCNRFGESILNMACRRGFTKIVQYLLLGNNDSATSNTTTTTTATDSASSTTDTALYYNNTIHVRVCDDCGRTPVHDACWYPEPQIDICTILLQLDAFLFLITDQRGYTPFQYARQNDWYIWRQFLYNNCYTIYHTFCTQPKTACLFYNTTTTTTTTSSSKVVG